MSLADIYNQEIQPPAGEESEDQKKARNFYEGIRLEQIKQVDEKVEVVDEVNPYDAVPGLRSVHVWMTELPRLITDKLRDAAQSGRLSESLKHWTGVLESGELADKNYVKRLKEFQGRVSSDREKNKELTEEIVGVLGELSPQQKS